MPAASNHSRDLPRQRRAAGDEEARSVPPKRSRILLKTSLSASECLSPSQAARRLALAAPAPRTSRPTSNAQWKIFALSPPSASVVGDDLGVDLLEDARRGRHEGRLDHRRGSRRSCPTRPSTAVAKPICSCAASSTLPKECASGSQRYCRSSLAGSGRAPRSPRPRRSSSCGCSTTPLGRPVVPGGVDQRGEVVGLHRGRRVVDRRRVLGEVGVAERGQLVERDHPVAVAGAVEDDHLAHARQGLVALP